MAQLKNTTISDTGNLNIPSGTTAQRPATPLQGMIRYNTTLNDTEYYDGSVWRSISDTGIEATGGTIIDTEIGGVEYRIHQFTAIGNSTFTVTKGGEVEYLIVAGGGGGGSNRQNGNQNAGGGGAGGLLTGFTTVTPQTYTVTVGAGGLGGVNSSTNDFPGNSGGNSSIFSQTAIGGGGGGNHDGTGAQSAGGSGGGAARGTPLTGANGIAGQGNAGGNASDTSGNTGGGGGGASSAGRPGTGVGSAPHSDGGDGLLSNISGNLTAYAGGGGGSRSTNATFGRGGYGGGGQGSSTNGQQGFAGAPNTGGGGGGGYASNGGNGGSGIVVVRYRKTASTTTSPNRVISRPIIFPIESVNNLIVRDGLILDLDAANTRSYPNSGNIWFDMSGQNNNFTLENSPTFTGSSFIFNGINQAAIIGSSSLNLLPTDNRTIEIWFKLIKRPITVDGLNVGGLFADQTSTTGALMLNFNNKLLWRWDDASYSNDQTNSQIYESQWVQAVVVLRGSYLISYFINGQLDRAEFTSSDTASGGNTAWSIARQNRSFSGDLYHLNCEVSIARQYNRNLSLGEIQQNFNATQGRYGI
jgi:hypothetical protein